VTRSPLLPDQTWRSPLKAGVIRDRLVRYGHPSREFVGFVFSGCTDGFHLLVDIPVGGGGFERANLRSATEHPEQVTEYVRKELAEKRFLGPFRMARTAIHPDLIVSPWGSVPKTSAVELVVRRVITHLSAGPDPGERAGSVNSFTVGGLDVLFPTRGDFTFMVSRLLAKDEGEVLMFKTDLVGAFRVVPLHPALYHLLGFAWEGEYLVDTRLGFGSRSGPFLFQVLSNALHFIINAEIVEVLGEDAAPLLNMLDDFLGAAVGMESAAAAFEIMMSVMNMCGLATAEHKTSRPCQVMGVLGMEYTTEGRRLGVRLPGGKAAGYAARCVKVAQAQAVAKQDLLTLAGKLVFAEEAYPLSTPLTAELFAAVHRGGFQPTHWVRPSKRLREHLRLWAHEIADRSFRWMEVAAPLTLRFEVYGDASGTEGVGAFEVTEGEAFSGLWSACAARELAGLAEHDSSTLREMLGLVAAVAQWRPEAGAVLGYTTDSQTLVATIKKGRSTAAPVNACLVWLNAATRKGGARFRCRWQRRDTPHQIAADLLSRVRNREFLQMAREYSWSRTGRFTVSPLDTTSLIERLTSSPSW